MAVVLLQIKPLLIHRAVGIVVSRRTAWSGQLQLCSLHNVKNNCQIYSTSDFRQGAVSTATINANVLYDTVRQQLGGSYPPKYPPVAIHKIIIHHWLIVYLQL